MKAVEQAADCYMRRRVVGPRPTAKTVRVVHCLEQPLGALAAGTMFLLAALGPVLDTLGNRGYRAAQLEPASGPAGSISAHTRAVARRPRRPSTTTT